MANPLRRFAGDPVHPATVHFPLALFPAATLFDVLALTLGDGSVYTRGAFVLIAAASVAALLAMTTGFVQLLDVPPESHAWRLVLWHMSVQLLAACVLVTGLVLRLGHLDDAHAPISAIVINIVGSGILLFGGWLGGHLVFSHGVSVEAEADALLAEAATPTPMPEPLELHERDIAARR